MLILFGFSHESQAKKDKAKRPHGLAIVHNNRGVTQLYEGNAERALFEFQTAVEIDPNYIEAQTNVGVAFKVLNQLDPAKQAFERAIALDKDYATPYNHLGTIYFSKRNYSEAINLFETAIKKNKKFADAWLNLGLAYIAMANDRNGDINLLKQAIDPLRHATDIDTSYARAHLELAHIYDRLGDYDKAIIRFKLALETNPNDVDPWIQLGMLYLRKEEILQAKTAFSRAIQLSPQSPAAHLNLGLAYLKESNFPLAIAELETTIQFAPTSEAAYYNIGYAYYLMGNQQNEAGNHAKATEHYQAAITAYSQAFQLNPTLIDAAYNAGYTAAILQQPDQAREWYKRALANDPKHARTLLALGLLEADTGHGKEASGYLCRVMKDSAGILTAQEKTLVDAAIAQSGGCH